MELTALRISSSSSSFTIIRHCSFFQSTKLFSFSISTNSHTNHTLKVDNSCRRASKDGIVFDDATYETECLSLDALARDFMAEASERQVGDEDDPKVWKWVIEKRVWDLMEGPELIAEIFGE